LETYYTLFENVPWTVYLSMCRLETAMVILQPSCDHKKTSLTQTLRKT
jgi:hypothetical protein